MALTMININKAFMGKSCYPFIMSLILILIQYFMILLRRVVIRWLSVMSLTQVKTCDIFKWEQSLRFREAIEGLKPTLFSSFHPILVISFMEKTSMLKKSVTYKRKFKQDAEKMLQKQVEYILSNILLMQGMQGQSTGDHKT